MKDQHSLTPLKRISYIFLTITALSVTSSWLTSCSETAVAASDHSGIENRLGRIEAQLNDQGTTVSEMNKTVTTMAGLTSKLSDDIGLMADRIVETEYLIVQVITNQTAAAEGVINKATNADGSPMLDKSKLPANTKTADLLVLNQILKGHSGSNGVLLSNNTITPVTPTTTTPPSLKFNGSNVSYLLMVSTVATFGQGKTTQLTVTPNVAAGNPENLTKVWTDMLASLFPGGAGGQTVYVAVKVNTAGNLSAMSNSLTFSNL
ncbi:MAG: hypothetical protein ACC653_06485 [Gammaproteobacteria bacterium]